MEQEAKKILGNRFKELPKALQDAILSVDLRKKLGEISTKFRLHVDEAGVLEDQTTLVMLALESPDEFAENLVREIHIQPAQAQLIMGEVNEKIFLPIRETLREVVERDTKAEEQENQRVTQTSAQGLSSEQPFPLKSLQKLPTTAPSAVPPQREQLIKEIETISTPSEPKTVVGTKPAPEHHTAPPPPNLPVGDITEAKLAGIVMPKEELPAQTSVQTKPAELPVIQPEAPKKAELLKQIETISLPAEPKPMAVTQPAPQNIPPSPFSAPMGNFAEAKLAGMFTMPKQDMRLTTNDQQPRTTDNKQPTTNNNPLEQKKYTVDPYKEPLV